MSHEHNSEQLHKLRHSLSHIMAQAVQRVQQADVEIAIGPAIDNGFYYDFLFAPEKQIKDEDLPKINEMMIKIVKEGQTFTRLDVSNEESEHIVKKVLKQKYKAELRDEFATAGEGISFYLNSIPMAAKENLLKGVDEEYVKYYEDVTQYFQEKHPEAFKDRFVTFLDMCEGPHVESMKEIDPWAFKVAKTAGAYRRGDSKNIMMTRLYAYAFETKEGLKEYLNFLEEARKRDHRVLGQELDLFCFSDLVGPGLPLYTPRGTIIKEELQKEVEKICRSYGWQKVYNPHLANIKLFELSWHATKFSEELFHVSSEKGHEMVLKPVLCPHHTQLYASRPRSYKDLPIRYMESEKMHRAELQGSVGGLSRVYAITVEDGHVFCTVDQVKDEVVKLVNIIKDFYSSVGMRWNHWVSLSVRDYAHPEKYIGEPKDWDTCEAMLEEISNELGLDAKRREGEAALYGPKLDFMFKDALGREVQIPTVQLDFATPKRFELVYTDSHGEKNHPVMVHRAILGSYERFMMLLIEHYAGAFPLWLAPEQVRIVPVADAFMDYARKVEEKLKEEGFRVSVDDGSESFSKKIRNAEVQKVPYILILGEKEEKAGSVNVREFKTKEQYEMKVKEFVEKLTEVREKKW